MRGLPLGPRADNKAGVNAGNAGGPLLVAGGISIDIGLPMTNDQ